jgi:hypothetical protein
MKRGIGELKLCVGAKDFVLKLNKVVMDELKLAVTVTKSQYFLRRSGEIECRGA